HLHRAGPVLRIPAPLPAGIRGEDRGRGGGAAPAFRGAARESLMGTEPSLTPSRPIGKIRPLSDLLATPAQAVATAPGPGRPSCRGRSRFTRAPLPRGGRRP